MILDGPVCPISGRPSMASVSGDTSDDDSENNEDVQYP